MSDEFKIEIVNPEKSFLSKEDVNEVVVPAFEGEMGILKDHISIISFLKPGIITIQAKSGEEKFYVEDGIIEFKNNTLSILTSYILNLKDIEKNCNDFAKTNDIELSLFQSNIEGELVNKIQNSRENQDGLIINAGGYTHTSVAILDALKILKIPIIELHISNIYNREDFRHKSLISKVARGVICGFGSNGYVMALDAMKKYIENENR